MIKYLTHLLYVICALGVFCAFLAPALISAILVIICNQSGWWFMLLILYIPMIALLSYACEGE